MEEVTHTLQDKSWCSQSRTNCPMCAGPAGKALFYPWFYHHHPSPFPTLQLDGCRSLLTEVLSHPHLSSSYPSSYVLQARAKLLAASLLQHRPPSPLLTPEQVLDQMETSPTSLLHPHFSLTPLELAMDALRLLQGVVSGDAHKKGEEAQKRASVEVRGWELCEGLMEALKMVANVHWLCGMVREAYHYAREGLKLARSKALRYWCVFVVDVWVCEWVGVSMFCGCV